MAKKLKDYYNTAYLKLIAEKISEAHSPFDKESFIFKTKPKLYSQEFLARQDIIANSLSEHLSSDYKKNLQIFTKILGPELQKPEGMFTEGWWLWPVGRYVEKNATTDHDASMTFIYELTKRYTGEFAIRPLIRKNPKKTLVQMKKWSTDDNVHVRRLSSEGMRISLPWTSKMTEAVEEFTLFSSILTNLKNDKEKFVQKSVGNNLNDLMKHDPRKANEIISVWRSKKVSRETEWVINHGTRSLRKHQ